MWIVILAYTVLVAISWLLTCGIIKLIGICFGLTIGWAAATGIWLVLFLLSSIFNGGK